MGKKSLLKILSNPSDDQIQNILNNLSSLYQHQEDVLYEYIQNSIDSAMEMKKENPENFSTRTIIIHIDEKNKRYIIQDNCKGIKLDEFKKMPNNTFDSRKKDYAWAVGQFGYGIQSFRKWFERIIIYSKNYNENEVNSIQFEKNSREAELTEDDNLLEFGSILDTQAYAKYKLEREFGTDVIIKGEKKEKNNRGTSFKSIYEKLLKSIPVHFEETINNKLVDIWIYNWITYKGQTRPQIIEIQTPNYDKIPGEYICGEILHNNKQLATYQFKIIESDYLKISSEIKNYLPRICGLNTEIDKISKMKSFNEYCEEKNIDNSIWNRPEIIGKINILTKIINIDRREIPVSEERNKIYDKLVEITLIIEKKIEEINKEKIKDSESALSEIISDVFEDISKEMDLEISARNRKIKSNKGLFSDLSKLGTEILLGKNMEKTLNTSNYKTNDLPGDLIEPLNNNTNGNVNNQESKMGDIDSPSESEGNNIQYENTKQRGFDLEIEPLGKERPPSELWGENKIMINSEHEYYIERQEPNKKKFPTRLLSYIAITAAPWYLDQYYKKKGINEIESKEKNEMIINIISKAEKRLWEKRDLIQRKIMGVEDYE